MDPHHTHTHTHLIKDTAATASNWAKNQAFLSEPQLPKAMSPFSFHPAKNTPRRDDQNNPIRSLPWISFAVNCLACDLEVSHRVAELAKGAAAYISIMTPIPDGITSDGTSTFCVPPKPLPWLRTPVLQHVKWPFSSTCCVSFGVSAHLCLLPPDKPPQSCSAIFSIYDF